MKKTYVISLTRIIEAKNGNEALREFWEMVNEAENGDVKIEVEK